MTELIDEIEKKIRQIEGRLDSGKTILVKVKQQLSVLKKKLKEYERLREQCSSSASDGNL